MNQHKFAFRVGVLVLLIAVMAGVFSVRLHNVQITQAAEQDPTPSGSVTYHTRVTAAAAKFWTATATSSSETAPAIILSSSARCS